MERSEALSDAWHEIRRNLDLHLFPGLNESIKSRCASDAELLESHHQPVRNARRVVLDLPVMPKRGVGVRERRLGAGPPHTRVVSQDLIDKCTDAGICLRLQPLSCALGFIGVVIDDRVPEVEGDAANRH